jgi:4'-phosphopantetheinyl transferase EntD
MINDSKALENKVWAALRGLFSSACAVAAKAGSAVCLELPEAEARAVAGAVMSRRSEFAAGRWAARQALAAAGFPGAVIPSGADRAPIWPEGALGSISHSCGVAVAVAANKRKISALGVDIERSSALTEELWNQVMVSGELDRLRRLPGPFRCKCATAIFCIKEAFFKLQFSQTHTWIDFHEAEVRLNRDLSRWHLRLSCPISIQGIPQSSFTGMCWIGESLTMAGAYETNGEQN